VIVRPMIGQWEPPAIERIEVVESRRLARLPVPGLMGDLHQDLGANSLSVAITGSLQGDERRSAFLEELREAFLEGSPMPFVSDITEASELEDVLIVGFEVSEANEWGDEFRYRIELRQYVEPPEPPGLLDDLGIPDLAALAAGLLDGLELPDLLSAIPNVADPTEALQPALDEVRAATDAVPALLGDLESALGIA
jgi:hypothetical protein